jgi:hypothetical protein
MHNENSDNGAVQLPRPTVWPVVMALGLSLVMAGLVTSVAVGLLGGLLTLLGAVGWFRQVLPHEVHEGVPVSDEVIAIESKRTLMYYSATSSTRRLVQHYETFRMTTGLKAGIAGGIAMTVPAGIFSLLRYHSFWYAMNLLAAGGFVSWAHASDTFLSAFHLQGLLAAMAIHGLTSLLVGLLYGAMLQMFPKYPILTAGFMVPFIFTAVLYSALGIVSPILNARIDWFWFVPSQIVFGLVCGYVVNLYAKVRTPEYQALPFAVRAGLHGDLQILTYKPDENATQEDSSQGDTKQ